MKDELFTVCLIYTVATTAPQKATVQIKHIPTQSTILHETYILYIGCCSKVFKNSRTTPLQNIASTKSLICKMQFFRKLIVCLSKSVQITARLAPFSHTLGNKILSIFRFLKDFTFQRIKCPKQYISEEQHKKNPKKYDHTHFFL